MSDWASKFCGQGKGVKAGPAVLVSYLKEIRETTIEADYSDWIKLDVEAFVRHMDVKRGWCEERALAKWRELQADKKVKRDLRGPKEMPLRLYVDPVLACNDFERRGREHREEKIYREEAKQKKGFANDLAQKASLIDELARGHSEYSGGSAAAMAGESNPLAEALAPGSFTSDAAVDVGEELCKTHKTLVLNFRLQWLGL